MNVAFLVQAHTNAKQVLRFVKSLSQLGDVYIHVDKKAKDAALMEGLSNMKGEKFEVMPFQLISVNWGGYSQVRCQHALLQKALERTENTMIACSSCPVWITWYTMKSVLLVSVKKIRVKNLFAVSTSQRVA